MKLVVDDRGEQSVRGFWDPRLELRRVQPRVWVRLIDLADGEITLERVRAAAAHVERELLVQLTRTW